MQRFSIALLVSILLMTSVVAVPSMPGHAAHADQGTGFGAPPGPPRASLDLLAEYTFDVANSTALGWTLGQDGKAGKRLSFPLGRGSVKTYATTSQVRSAVNHGRPMLLLNRNGYEEPYTYTLVLIGNPELPLSLQLERAQTLDKIFPNLYTAEQMQAAKEAALCPPSLPDQGIKESRVLTQSLATGSAQSAALRGELLARNGTYVPITITHIDFLPDAQTAQLCYQEPGFVLLAPSHPGWQDYQLHMVLNNNIAGPPGEGSAVLCAEWESNHWWLRFLRALFGC